MISIDPYHKTGLINMRGKKINIDTNNDNNRNKKRYEIYSPEIKTDGIDSFLGK